jgi:gluconokinase
MAESAILAIDIGSSSVRASLYDEDLQPVECGPAARRTYSWRTDSAGAMEYDATSLFEHVCSVMDVAVERAAVLKLRVAGVAPTTFWHSLVGLDAYGAPMTPLFGWGDTRAQEAAKRLRRSVDPDRYHERTGCFLHPAYPMAKLSWLRHSEPAFSGIASWVSFGEYLESRLLGIHRCSLSSASGMGLLNLAELRWDAEALDAVGVGEEQLFPLVELEPARVERHEFRQRWPSLSGADWLPPIGDGACANIGTGAIGPADPGLTIGTSAAIRVLWEAERDAPVPNGLWCYVLDARRRVAGGALSNGGNAVAFLRSISGSITHESVAEDLERAAPDSHGLTVLPTLVGERGIDWSGERSAALIGLRLETRPEEIVRAFMEGISYRLLRIHSLLEARFGESRTVHVSGGALHSYPGWIRILSDTLGRVVRRAEDREATSRGAALVAAEVLGWTPDLAAAPGMPGIVISPDARRTPIYRRAAERQWRLAETLRPWLASTDQVDDYH